MKIVSSPERNDLLAGALALAAAGLRVLPNEPHQKKPIYNNWQNLATADPAADGAGGELLGGAR